MSEEARLTGRIPIAPPIQLKALYGSAFLPENQRTGTHGRDWTDVAYEVIEQELIEGTYRKVAVAVVPSSEGRLSFYEVANDLWKIADEITVAGSRLDADSYLTRFGETQGDVARYAVVPIEDGTAFMVRTERATLRWPDGTEVAE